MRDLTTTWVINRLMVIAWLNMNRRQQELRQLEEHKKVLARHHRYMINATWCFVIKTNEISSWSVRHHQTACVVLRHHKTSLDGIKHYAISLDSMRQHETAGIACMRHHETSPWDITMGHLHGTSPWDITMRHHHETSPWDISMGHHHGTSP